jgi:radical SAM superfamily enzyme YgiQ (UPF0313 family)
MARRVSDLGYSQLHIAEALQGEVDGWSMPKVAIIRPSRFGFGARIDDWERTWVQHGIASIIAYASKQGLPVDLIEIKRLKNWNEFQELVSRYKYLGLSCFTSDLTNTTDCIDKIKEVDSAKIIVGGAHANIRPQDFTSNPKVDHVILGEGEISFVNLINALEQGIEQPRIIQGIRPDLDSIPYINRDMWLPEDDGIWNLGKPFFTLISSRACWKNCRFCQPYARTVFGTKMRNRSVEHVIGELKQLKEKYGLKSFFLLDDNVLQDIRWVSKFIQAYRDSKIDAEFIFEGSADYLSKNPDVIKQLSEIGCRWFNVGFESGSQRVLDYMRKGTTVEQNEKAVEILRANNIRIFANIMFGIPMETKKEALETVEFVRQMQPDWFSPAFYTPYPGNELARECEEAGLIINYKDSVELSRSVGKPKIKGVNYRFLNECLLMCRKNGQTSILSAVLIKITSYVLYLDTKYNSPILRIIKRAIQLIEK